MLNILAVVSVSAALFWLILRYRKIGRAEFRAEQIAEWEKAIREADHVVSSRDGVTWTEQKPEDFLLDRVWWDGLQFIATGDERITIKTKHIRILEPPER